MKKKKLTITSTQVQERTSFKSYLLERRLKRHHLGLSFVVGIMIIVITVAYSNSSLQRVQAEEGSFFPTDCKGNWENIDALLVGKKEMNSEENNSTSTSTSLSELVCGEFIGEIPETQGENNLYLKLAWREVSKDLPEELGTLVVDIENEEEDVTVSIDTIQDDSLQGELDVTESEPILEKEEVPMNILNEVREIKEENSVPQEKEQPVLDTIEELFFEVKEAEASFEEGGEAEPVKEENDEPNTEAIESEEAVVEQEENIELEEPLSEEESALIQDQPQEVIEEDIILVVDQPQELIKEELLQSDIENSSETVVAELDGGEEIETDIVEESSEVRPVIEVSYTIDGEQWVVFDTILQQERVSSFRIPFDVYDSNLDFSKIEVSVKTTTSLKSQTEVIIDQLWLELDVIAEELDEPLEMTAEEFQAYLDMINQLPKVDLTTTIEEIIIDTEATHFCSFSSQRTEEGKKEINLELQGNHEGAMTMRIGDVPEGVTLTFRSNDRSSYRPALEEQTVDLVLETDNPQQGSFSVPIIYLNEETSSTSICQIVLENI